MAAARVGGQGRLHPGPSQPHELSVLWLSSPPTLLVYTLESLWGTGGQKMQNAPFERPARRDLT